MYQPPLRGRPVLVGKKVLLMDPYEPTRDARSSVLHNYEVELDVADSLQVARCLWRPRLYDWVLLDVRRCLPEDALAFYEQIRDASYHEHVVFFVGPPQYLSLDWPAEVIAEDASSEQWRETVDRFLTAA
jgi:hypothetical protein